MSEISKLYDNAGIEKRCLHPTDCIRKGICRGAVACEHYDYPPFTAEKQLALIKLLGNCKGYPDYEGFGADFDCYAQLYEFETALVKSINDRWQYLADGLKQQVKGILE